MNDAANITLIILASLIFLILLIIIYIKLKYPFWSSQPVFHFYDFYYWLFSIGIIRQDLPERNKFCNFIDVETILSTKMKDYKMCKFINLIQCHFLKNGDNEFLPQKKNIAPYFLGHNSLCFYSFYWENVLLNDTNTSINTQTITNTIEDKKLVGCMTSRPLHVQINNGNKDAIFDVYYVDYLCIDKRYRKKGIAPQIIQTHEYNQRHLNHNIQVSLFKREDNLTGIVPLTVYSTFGFSMKTWNMLTDLPPSITLIECNPQNIYYLHDFIKKQYNLFDICIMPEFTNIAELIKTQNIYIYMILIDNEVMSAYFFRKACTFIRKDEEALSCFASINGGIKSSIFIHGYKVALWKICNRQETVKKGKKHVTFKSKFNYAVIESISHNDIIIKNLLKKTRPEIISPTAYFFYNFAYSTFKSKKVFILN
jgi:hypothetical protein